MSHNITTINTSIEIVESGGRACSDKNNIGNVYNENIVEGNVHIEKMVDGLIKLDKKYNINSVECGNENIGVRSRLRCKMDYYEYYMCSEQCKKEVFNNQFNTVEFLDCSYCNKNVDKGLSILCEICKSWCHKKCIKHLSNKDFADLSNVDIYWSCYNCNINIFPFFQLNDHDFYFAGRSLNDEMAALNFYDTCRCITSRQTKCTHCVVKDIHHFSVDMFDFKNCNFDHRDD